MPSSNTLRGLSVLWCAAALAACAGPQPIAYQGLESTSYLQPNQHDASGRVPYAFDAHPDWSGYSALMIEPVVVYQGGDNQFGTMSAGDRAALAASMQQQFSAALGKKFQLVTTPGAQTLRLRLTLTGAKASTAVISTFSRFDIAGNLYNATQAVRGGNGMATGWVMYAAEIYDSGNGQLLKAYETKQYPFAYNLPATFGSLSAAKTGIGKGADALSASLE